ncbi:hypothetical protein Taro_010768 [Colocasia esculenta]|uniref:Multifunctional methyltransferase subunit TRM112-like protein n=1 Tax=Colocasia esculenta TaxID=4460 RepID=A0A843U7W5_COLES|nr:hypothetical protein [Colocasia esculenta]
MRLLTHNMLASNVKGVVKGYPLRLEAEAVAERPVDLNPDFLRHIFSRLDWPALVAAARSLPADHAGAGAALPDEADPSMLDSDDFLRHFHHALLELHVEEGALVCPETGRRFPINKGIPNMLLNEDEPPQCLICYLTQNESVRPTELANLDAAEKKYVEEEVRDAGFHLNLETPCEDDLVLSGLSSECGRQALGRIDRLKPLTEWVATLHGIGR